MTQSTHSMGDVSLLRTGDLVAHFLGTSRKRLDYHLYVRPTPYVAFEIPKTNGGVRQIEAPPHPIRAWQRRLANSLVLTYQRKRGAFGFCLGGGTVRNADWHKRPRLLLNLDLEDFFHSITFARVYGMFGAHPFNLGSESRAILAHLCTYRGRLPQGSPTSPIISNFICRTLDNRLARIALHNHCRYSRYADDISFSTKKSAFSSGIVSYRDGHDVGLGNELKSAINKSGFTINSKKVWVRTRKESQRVTGITVNTRQLNVPRSYVRNLRSMLNNWRRDGLRAAESRFRREFQTKGCRNREPSFVQHVSGKLAYLKQVKGTTDPVWARYALEFAELQPVQGAKPIVLHGRAAQDRNTLKHAVWPIEIEHPEHGVVGNGTGFWLEGHGLVTNHHVVDLDQYARDWECPRSEFQIKTGPSSDRSLLSEYHIERSCKHHDIAVGRCTHPPIAQLKARAAPIEVGETAVVTGFPNYHPGNQLRIEESKVTQSRVASLVNMFEVSARILAGNSGGPVIDGQGLVAGIAQRGADSPILEHSAVCISHMHSLPSSS